MAAWTRTAAWLPCAAVALFAPAWADADTAVMERTPALSITAPLISTTPAVNVGETDGSVVLTVKLDPASSGTVTVDYFTIAGNAQEDQDYAETSGTLIFEAGDTSRTITVPIIDDAGYDRLRLLFFVGLRNASGATLPSPHYARVVIESDEPKPTATIDDVAVNEAAGRMTLTLRLNHTSSDTIEYLTNGSLVSGTATAAADYGDFLQGSDAVITMPARALSATFDIAIVDDTEEEGDETIGIVWRKHPDHHAKPDSLAFTGTIRDNDTDDNNASPTFNEGGAATRSFAETVGGAAVTSASNIGDAVTATDTDAGDTLAYSLEGADASKFTIVSTSGQLRTRVDETYDRETKARYAVTVKVMDGSGGSDTIAVTLLVTNAVEAPLAPTVTATSGGTTSLDVSWRAPENAGRPAIANYDIQYRAGTSGPWTDGPQDRTGTGARITGLTASTAYQVRVRATNGDGDGAWSENASASTGARGNSAATGAPGISGTVRVGQTLTATTTDIADASGLTDPPGWAYQWIRSDGMDEQEIPGATAATYVLTEDDLGSTIRVRVTFTDGAGYEESVTSEVSVPVPPIPVPVRELPVLGIADASATEGSPVQFTVTLSDPAPTGGITLQFSTSVESDDTATTSPAAPGGADFTSATDTTVTIPATQTTVTFSVPTADDTTNEPDETFTVTIDNPSEGAVLGDSTSAKGTIVDNDTTAVTLTADPASVDEDEGATAVTVTATLEAAAMTVETVVTVSVGGAGDTLNGITRDEPTTLTLSVGASTDTAIKGTDYTAVDDLALTIDAGQTSGTATFTLTPTNDGIVEGNETLSVSGTTGVEDLTVTGASVTIGDDDERRVAISPTSLTLAEGDSATYTVVLGSKPTGTVRVTISGTTGTDLRRSRSFLSFRTSNWNEPQTVTVTARQDEDAEDDTVTISHAVSGADYEANGVTVDAVSVTIDDDDRVSTGVDLSVSHTSFDEDASFTGVVVTGTLNGIARAEPTTLTLSVGASEDAATEGTDYVAVDDLGLTIPAGQASATAIFVFKPTDDLIDEPAEAVSITGATGVADFEVTGTTLVIKDNDERGVTVSPTDLALTEGGSATYTVVLNTEPTETVTVTPSVSGRADVTVSAALTFTASDWDEAQTVTVTAAQDADAGNDKATIGHAVSGADYGANSATADDISVTVEDDETAVLLTVNPTAVDEDAEAITTMVTATFDGVTRDEPTTLTVSVGASDDAAIAGTDYVAVDELSITIPSGQASFTASFTFTPLEDRIDERVEAVSITGTTEAVGFAASGTTLSIDDNDERGVTVSPSDLSVSEGTSATYTVVLDTEPTGTVTVTPSLGSGDTDVTVSGALTFTATDWDQAQTVTVSAAQDADAAHDTATIGHAVSGADYGANGATANDVSVTVDDNETAVALTVNPTAVDEDAEAITATVTATLDGVTRAEPTTLTVSVGAADDAAIAGTDYVAVDELSLTIPSGQASGTATFTLTPMEDRIDERVEAVTIAATSEVAGFEVSGTTLAITDNDERGVTVSPAALTLSEGESATYTVVLDTEPTETVTVTPSVNGNADVTASAALTFTPSNWDQAQTVTVSAAQDADAANDTAAIGHSVSGADYGANSVTANDVSVTVDDNETAVTLTVNPTVVDEDAEAITATVTAMLDGVTRAASTTLTVSVGAADDAAIEGTDYVAVDDLSLTIPSGQASGTATFTLTPMEDRIDEAAEAVTIAATSEVAGLEVIGTTLVITDNDERGVTVSPAALTLSEGESATYTVVLDTEPTETVTVTPTVSGSPDVAFEPSSLTFTSTDWDTAQTMTISATEDDDAYHDSSIVSHVAKGAEYASLVDGELSLTISDNEVASQDTLPVQVTDVSVTATATHVDLTWSAVDDAVLGYRVEASYDGGANWAEVEDNPESADTTYQHDVGLNFSETRRYRVSAVGENGAGLPSVSLQASATATTGGLTATVPMPQDTTIQVPAIDVCWIPEGVEASELSDVALATTPVYSSRSDDLNDLPWQSIGSGSSEVDCEDGIGFRQTSISANQRYAFRMRANHDGVWLVSNDAQAVLADSSKPLRTVVTAGASGLSGDTPVPNLICRDYDDPATREDEAGSFFLSIGFTTASPEYLRYEPVNGFDPSGDLTLVNATAQLLEWPYDTRLGYRVRITPSVWGEPVAVSVAGDVVTHGETSVGNRASGEFRRETADAADCDTSTPEPVRRSQVTAVGIEQDGDRNGEWTAGEPIRVTLQFDEPVGVDMSDGVPSVTLTLGEAATEVMVPFSHVAHEDTLVFEHPVTADESPISNITLLADSLSLNGGQIDSFSGPAVGLAHPEAAVVGGQIVQPDLTAGWSTIPGAHEGSESHFEIHLQFSEVVDLIEGIGEQNLLDHAFTVTGGAIEAIRPTRDRRGEYLANEWAMRVVPASEEPVTISPVVELACDQPGAICTIDDRPLTEAPSVTVHRTEQGLSVADTEVGEGPGAVLVFEVTLARAADEPVTVDYETADGTATAGEDYEAESGTLSIEAGQTAASVQVRVLDDSHDEGEETLTLVLTNATNAQIHGGEALGVIVNSDPIPSAWLARFGRAASDHVAQAVARRLERGPSEEHMTVGGLRLDRLYTSFADPDGGRAATGSTHMDLDSQGSPGDMTAPYGGRSRGSDTLPSLHDALMGSSFFYTDGESEDASSAPLTAWGETASTRFKGSEGSLSLDGEVTTAMLGLDKRYGRWLVGSTLSYSEGEGGYRGSGALGGSMESTLTSLNPYAHFELNETTSLWGVFGYGSGSLRVTPEGAESAIETDLSNRMAAFGGRGLLSVRSGDAGRFELALRSDALVTRTDSEAVQGLVAARGATSRVRLMLEGSGSMPLATGGVLKPSLEAGLRYDGGDAETGAGIELGGGLGYAAGNLSVEVNARALVAHEDTDYEEWGFSGSLAYTPGKDGRGLSMKLGSAWGSTQSGVQSLWSRQDASGLAGTSPFEAAQRFQAELGYGIAGRRKAALWVPFIAAQAADGDSQSLRMGVKLTSGPNIEAGLELGRLENRRLENGRGAPEHAVQLRGALRW